MTELNSKAKRQIEILGICLQEKKPGTISVGYLADYFNVDDVTIKRDLKDIRFNGIDIHSSYKKGIHIQGGIDTEVLRSLLLNYIGICYAENIFDKSTALLIEKQKSNALSYMVLLQSCVEQRREVVICYESVHPARREERTLRPLIIFHSEGSWRVLSQDGNQVKQFHLDKITKVEPADNTFERMDMEQFLEMFRYSWGSWLGYERFDVKIKFSRQWAERIKPRMWVPEQKITDFPDGSFTLEVKVNTLREIAGWLVSRGEGVVIVEPPELREMVRELAETALKNLTS